MLQEVTNEEVKTFLDPTAMINSVAYSFAANFLGGGSTFYENGFRAF